MTSTAARAPARYTGVFRGRRIRAATRDVARYLRAVPANHRKVIASELATNAAIHSASQGRFFTLRCELHASHCRVEVEDLGGPWRRETGQDRPHGLDLVEALAGAGNWGVSGNSLGRTVWARLTW